MGRIGIVGGTGLYRIEGLKDIKEIKIRTPFGKPSDRFILGKLEDREIVFLARHGFGHRITPSKINYRANIYGFKVLGVERIISVSACGSLKEELRPLDFVIPLQFFDRTNQARKMTFFEKGITAHVSFSDPVCLELANIVNETVKSMDLRVHFGGTYINMEGPQFSTRAESETYRKWGMDIIGMTNMAEAKLAREAEICYCTLAAVTDYDCWYTPSEPVTAEMVIGNLSKNIENAKKILREVIPKIPQDRNCSCKDALKDAIVTPKKFIPFFTRRKLRAIIGKYL
jgi:5'-methylthioadenosine phosphorylase